MAPVSAAAHHERMTGMFRRGGSMAALVAAAIGLGSTGAHAAIEDESVDVLWTTDVSPVLNLSMGQAVDFAFAFEVDGSEADLANSSLVLETCENGACYRQLLPADSGLVPYGIDASQYHRGLNNFKLTLTLHDWAHNVVVSDVLDFVVRVR